MYTTAELFAIAADPATSLEVFLNSVTISIPDDADGCVDLDAEKERLANIWELAHLSMRELVGRTGLSQTAFAKQAGIPLRTVQGGAWASATARHTSAFCLLSTTSCCKIKNPPLCLQSTPRRTQGFGKAGDFFL